MTVPTPPRLRPGRRPALLLCLALVAAQAVADETLWLSDSPPHAGHGDARHAHGGPVVIRRGVYHKQLWLRLGTTPQDSGYLQAASRVSPLQLLDTAGNLSEQPLARDEAHGLFTTEFAMPAEGFYNAYASHHWVDGDTREVFLAKAEVLKHSCREGHDDVPPKMPPRHNEQVPLEIVRERLPRENFHSLLAHGDTVSFVILRHGRPQSGAEVTLTTAQGWSRRAVSDGQGRVSYTLIRDYYPRWHEFEKRHPQPYLVSAVHTTDEAGEVDGKPYRRSLYRASFAGNYYPSPRDYASYAYGLAFALFALVATGIGVYIYRRRRRRPYREVRFDE